jgi:hypothetical protein
LKSNGVKYKAGNLQAEYQSWYSQSEGYDNHHLILKKISLHHSNGAQAKLWFAPSSRVLAYHLFSGLPTSLLTVAM